jgi:DNA-binding response OmpR family regulator
VYFGHAPRHRCGKADVAHLNVSIDALDEHVHALRLRRLLESFGYSVASVDAARGNLVTVVVPPSQRRERVRAGGLYLDPDMQLLRFEGRVVQLTASETSLLHALLVRANNVVPQHELIAALWPGGDPAVCKNRLYVHMFTLRRKLAGACAAVRIHGSRRGYRLAVAA